MLKPRALILFLCAGAALLCVLLLAHVRFYSSRSRLPEGGSAIETVSGLGDEITVLFDARGIPHVRAATDADAWFAQGHLHARDRFFQMELARRLVAGRLSEVFGDAAMDIDSSARIWRLASTARRQAAQLEYAERTALESYARGVNAALDRYGKWIAPEVGLLGVGPEPWKPEDSLGVGLLMQLNLSWAMGQELRRGVVLHRLGREQAIDLWGWSPRDARAWIPPGELAVSPRSPDDAITPGLGGVGSNNWALGPSRTASGRAILANDPHVGVQLPGTWYGIHLKAPNLHVAGLSIPGLPGVAIGHNERVAWCFTMSMVDDQDLYRVALDDHGLKEQIGSTWQPIRTVTEEIHVRGRAAPELLKVRLSERGPLVRETGSEAFALEWTAYRGPSSLGAFLNMARVTSAAEAAMAWRETVGPGMNMVAADVEGHILHQVVGMTPDRDRGAGRLPAPAQDPRWAWRGLEPFEANPAKADPPEGFVATANHDLFAEGDYPMRDRFEGEFAPAWRIRRIRERLAARDDWDVASCLELQGDVTSLRARLMLQVLSPDLRQHSGTTAQSLLEFDGRWVTDSVAPHLYLRWVGDLASAISGDDARRAGLGRPPFSEDHVLRLLVGGMDEAWWDDQGTPEVEDRSLLVGQSLDRMDALGPLAKWGEVHPVRFAHPLEQTPVVGGLIGRLFSRGPYAAPGGGVTVNAHYWSRERPFEVTEIPSARFVTEVGDWDSTVMVIPPGQSGRPWSVHYDDQVRPWLELEARTFAFSEAAVDKAATARLVLRPKAVETEKPAVE